MFAKSHIRSFADLPKTAFAAGVLAAFLVLVLIQSASCPGQTRPSSKGTPPSSVAFCTSTFVWDSFTMNDGKPLNAFAVSDLFIPSGAEDYQQAFRHFMESDVPSLAGNLKYWLETRSPPLPATSIDSFFSCQTFASYAEASSARTKLISAPDSQFGLSYRDAHWIPNGTAAADKYVATSTSPSAGTVPSKSASSSEVGRNTAPPIMTCKKLAAVRVTSEIRDTAESGSREVHLTVINGSLAKAECAFVAHKDGHWGVPGRQDIDPGQTMDFVSDTGSVSGPVAYKCVLFEDSQKSTTCFPPKWWLSAAPTIHK